VAVTTNHELWYNVVVAAKSEQAKQHQREYRARWQRENPEKRREYRRRHAKNNRAAIQAKRWRRYERIKAGVEALMVACTDCGEADREVLVWDHLPERGAKVANIMSLLWVGGSRLERELAKCEVVCCNCHARRTRRRLG
jgi:hypothetical protein